MGFWDFLKKKAGADEENVFERISVDELNQFVLNKKKDIEKQEQEFLKLVHNRINLLVQELEEKLVVLRNVDIDNKKSDERVKLIVKENLLNYANYVEKLLDKLKETSVKKDIIEKINLIFSDFEKRSLMSFEKATFLIGKEIGSIKDGVGKFFRDLNEIIKENKELLDKSKIIYDIEDKTEEINKINKIKTDIKANVNEFENKISKLKQEIKTKKKDIENIKKSKEFADENKKRLEIEMKRQYLEKEINTLREMIDFKALANIFHSNDKKMKIIKQYKDDFKEHIQKDNREDIINLLKEANIQNTNIEEKIKQIIKNQKEIEYGIINKTGIEDLEEEIRTIKSEMEYINLKISAEQRKNEKLDRNFKEINDLIKKELFKINIELTN
jgi:hypothetical protein